MKTGTGALVVVLGLGCGAPTRPTPASTAGASRDRATDGGALAPAETAGGGSAPAPQARRDDPASCVDPGYSSYVSRLAELERRLDEKLASLGSCVATRDERLAIGLYFRADGAFERSAVALSTTKDCKLSECLRRGLTDVRVPPGERPILLHWLNVALAPSATPQRVTWSALQGDAWQWSKCGDEKEKLKLPESVLTGEFRNLVIANAVNFATCYERGLARDESLRGRVHVIVVVDGGGRASSVAIAGNEISDCQVVECTRSEFSKLRYPPAKGGRQELFYPMNYQPQR